MEVGWFGRGKAAIMRSQRLTVYITLAVSLLSLFAAALVFAAKSSVGSVASWYDFSYDIVIGIFSGAVLSCATSVVEYLADRRRTLEAFNRRTNVVLNYLNTYDSDWDTEKKVEFFIRYSELDRTDWDMAFGDIAFLCDPRKKKLGAIYRKIYKPIQSLSSAVAEREYQFRENARYIMNGGVGNEPVMRDFLAKIEPLMMTETQEYEPAGAGVRCIVKPFNWLVDDVSKVLNSEEYYTYTYGRRTAKHIASRGGICETEG